MDSYNCDGEWKSRHKNTKFENTQNYSIVLEVRIVLPHWKGPQNEFSGASDVLYLNVGPGYAVVFTIGKIR